MANAVDPIEREDRRLHKLAAEKLKKPGTKLTGEERAAYKRIQKVLDREERDRVLSGLPIGEYCELAGRQPKVVREQAARYGMPTDRKIVDVRSLIRWMHDFLSQNSRKLAKADDVDPALGGTGEWATALRKETALKVRRERELLEGTLLPREAVHEFHVRVAAALRRLGEDLQRMEHKEAFDLLQVTLQSVERETRSFFGERDAA